MNLNELSLKDLKALAYDLLVQGEVAQQNLKVVQQEINKRLQPNEEQTNKKGLSDAPEVGEKGN
jgi:hypothetical protein